MSDAPPSTPPPRRPPLRSLDDVRRARAPIPNLNEERQKHLKALDRLAVWITAKVGTMGFFLVIFVWTALWLGWNFLAPKSLRFDPPMGFVFWLFISNVIQILLMPLIMVGQNVQGAYAEARADYDLKVNVRAEQEIEVVLEHLEYQNDLLLKMMQGLKLDIGDVMGRVADDGPAGPPPPG